MFQLIKKTINQTIIIKNTVLFVLKHKQNGFFKIILISLLPAEQKVSQLLPLCTF
jgi:hypothetical protein